MQVKLSQYREGLTGTFYIQCKGLHSGRPMLTPIPNCFVVQTDTPEMYQIAYALWVGRFYEPFIKGSVIPYIRLGDAMVLLLQGWEQRQPKAEKLITTLQAIDRQMHHVSQQLTLTKELKTAIARQMFRG
jgi:hypothetical protein